MPPASEWRQDAGGGTRPQPQEYWKLVLIAGLLLVCGLSYFFDPWSLTDENGNSPPLGSLSVNVNLGVNPQSFCKAVIQAESECKKANEAKNDPQNKPKKLADSDKSETGDGWMALLRQAGGIADQQASQAGGAGGSAGYLEKAPPCAKESERAMGCKVKAREARGKVQLRCNSQIVTAWKCQHSGQKDQEPQGDAKKDGEGKACANELADVKQCATRIMESDLRAFAR